MNWCDLMQNLKEALADDTLPDGTNVKKGDAVVFHAYGMGRMPYLWGPDASDFKPERWIKDGVFQPESHFKYIAFQVSRFSLFLFLSLPPPLPLPFSSRADRSSNLRRWRRWMCAGWPQIVLGQGLLVLADEDHSCSVDAVL